MNRLVVFAIVAVAIVGIQAFPTHVGDYYGVNGVERIKRAADPEPQHGGGHYGGGHGGGGHYGGGHGGGGHYGGGHGGGGHYGGGHGGGGHYGGGHYWGGHGGHHHHHHGK